MIVLPLAVNPALEVMLMTDPWPYARKWGTAAGHENYFVFEFHAKSLLIMV
jgi:hypothetical protein